MKSIEELQADIQMVVDGLAAVKTSQADMQAAIVRSEKTVEAVYAALKNLQEGNLISDTAHATLKNALDGAKQSVSEIGQAAAGMAAAIDDIAIDAPDNPS